MNNQWPGLSADAWNATKDRLSATAQGRSHVRIGLRYASDVAELVAEVEALRAMVRTQDANLTAVQVESTRQCNQIRGCTYFCADPEWRAQLHAIHGAAFEAICKHGPFTPRLTNIPDGTGGPLDTDLRNTVQAMCTRAENDGTLTWRLLIQEEVAEAFAETEPAKIRAELAQLGALCVAWMMALDARGEQ